MATAHCQGSSARGLLIAVEGIDGSGKATLASAVRNILGASCATEVVSSPGYERTQAGRLIGRYLDGTLVVADDSPFTIAMLFAIDRQETQPYIRSRLDAGVNVVADRYVFSNAAYQAARSDDPESLREWILDLEFERLKCPVADLNVLIDMPPARAKALIARKTRRSYTSSDLDRYEADDRLMRAVAEQYGILSSRSSRGRWLTLRPEHDGGLRDPLDMAREVLDALGQPNVCA